MKTLPIALGLSLFVLAPSAGAQILAVGFKDAKAEKKFAKVSSLVNGRVVVIGEPKSGIRIDGNTVNYTSNAVNELFVADPADPGEVAYTVDGDEKEETSKKHVVRIQGKYIDRIWFLMREESLPGLAKEYGIRAEQIEDYEADRDAHDKSTGAWQSRHVRLVSAMERLERWLRNTGFTKSADKLVKEIERQEKVVRGEAVRARWEKAESSLKTIEPPETLVNLAKEVSGGSHTFKARESQHLRIYYIDEIADATVEDAMRLGEEIIEGFRVEFVDPYLDESYGDWIPDGVFHEWLYVPDTDKAFEAYAKRFHNFRWDEKHHEEVLKTGGMRRDGSRAAPYANCRRNRDIDFQAVVCHDLGHSIAGLTYGAEAGRIQQDWISEGVGYYLSFEFMGRNAVTCKQFDLERAGYVKQEKAREQGEKTVGIGRRDVYNEVALTKGRPIDQLALRELVEMDDADLAKSWSFYDYLARKEGKQGQQWLRAAGKFSGKRETFLAQWREAAAAILGVGAADAFRSVEQRWRSYAETGQNVSGDARRRR